MYHIPLAAMQKIANQVTRQVATYVASQVARQAYYIYQCNRLKVLLPYIPEVHLGSIQVDHLPSYLTGIYITLANYVIWLATCQLLVVRILELARQKFSYSQLVTPMAHGHRFAPNKRASDETCLSSFSVQVIICFAILNKLLLCLSLVPSLIFLFYVHLLYLFASYQQ